MSWYLQLILALAPIAAVGLVFLVVNLILSKTGGNAPDWRFRCVKYGRIKDAAEAGVVRIGAASAGKRVLGYCSSCRRCRMLSLERKAAPL